MTGLSLRLRSVILAVVSLLIFIPVTVFTLDKAYTESLTQAKLSELKLMSLALVSAFELDGDIPYMPELLYEEQLNLPDSGYIGVIKFRGSVIWQSASALHVKEVQPPTPPPVGEEQFNPQYYPEFDSEQPYFVYAFTAEFAATNDFEPVHFYIINDKKMFSAERDTFLKTVWQWMLLLGVALLIILIAGTNVVLSPVRELIREIRLTARGEQASLSHDYPVEFDGLKRSINHLLEAEAQQRMRYKNSLGDLAHSLKTPLAVALGSENLPSQAREAMQQIDNLIKRQLKRASAGNVAWTSAIDVSPVVAKLIRAMQKVYSQRLLTLSADVASNVKFQGDETDLMEMLGNLLDNACKAADALVQVSAWHEGDWLHICVDDDGPGIPSDQREKLLARGERLDTYSEGQGIGLAVVADIVSSYGGRMQIEEAEAGGARLHLRLPCAARF